LFGGRHLAIEALDALANFGGRVHRAEIPAQRLLEQDVLQRGAGQIDRQLKVSDEPAIPSEQSPIAIEDTETLPHVFERALQQRALFGELLLSRAQLAHRALLAA